ncbi:hypothetical protein V2A84_01835 [Yersinia sp. 2553 StPb PI]|uniref:hypothetical protein n=1 Tax=Yersinia sp. 2553 StPb PI TaxID=3117411 RepID=UPI003FA433B7
MSTNINTINAIKGLTCAIDTFKHIEQYLKFKMKHPIKHLTDAANEIDRLNNENIKLQSEIVKLKAERPSRFVRYWESVIDAVSATAAGERVSCVGIFDPDIETNRAIAAINKTEADRKEAQRTAEAFQKTQSKVEPTSDLFDAYAHAYFTSYAPAHGILNGLTVRRPGKATYAQYMTISSEIINEANRASLIHPTWPTDAVHAVSILTEESGELMKAAIEYHYNNGDLEAVREEAVQTGAMALRVLMHIDKYKRPSDEK